VTGDVGHLFTLTVPHTHLLAPVLQILDQALFANLEIGVLQLHRLAQPLGLFCRRRKRLAILRAVRRDTECALLCGSVGIGSSSGRIGRGGR
jgi:hypothetical protein